MSHATPSLPSALSAKLAADWIAPFLQLPLIARLATASLQGRPHVVPVWFEWDGTTLWLTIDQRSKKYRNLVANPRAAVTIDESWGGLRFRGLIFEGAVELVTEPADWARATSAHIYTRYMGVEGLAAKSIQEMLSEGQHAVVKLTPDQVIVWNDIGGLAPVG
jgi:PPOX class probable F420-dependent enzyme